MALTEAEKRQKLRERRAAKMANSTARLSKITGEATPSTPAPAAPAPQVTTQSIAAATARPQTRSQGLSAASRRISRTFDDPPEGDIEEATKFMETLLGSVQHQHNNGNGNGDTNAASPDMSALAQLLGGMNGAQGGFPALGGVEGQEGANPLAALQQMMGGAGGPPPSAGEKDANADAVETSEQQLKNEKFKAAFMLAKLFIITLLTVFFGFENAGDHQYASTRAYGNSTFTQLLTAIEVISVSYFAYILHNTPDHHYNYNSTILTYMNFVPEQFLPAVWKNRIRLGYKYLELFKLVLFDLSIIVVMCGILSLFR